MEACNSELKALSYVPYLFTGNPCNNVWTRNFTWMCSRISKIVYICYNQSLRTTYNYPCVISTFKCSANQLLMYASGRGYPHLNVLPTNCWCMQVVEGGGTTYGFLIVLCDTMLFVGWLGPSSSRWFCCIHVIPFSPTQLQYRAGHHSPWNLIKSLILPIQGFHTILTGHYTQSSTLNILWPSQSSLIVREIL